MLIELLEVRLGEVRHNILLQESRVFLQVAFNVRLRQRHPHHTAGEGGVSWGIGELGISGSWNLEFS